MTKKKEEWRKVVEALVRVGAPYDIVKRFEVLTRHFFGNAERGFWPLHDSWRCDAFFASAAISKLFGVPVDRVRFVGPDESINDRLGRDSSRLLYEKRASGLLERLEGRNLRALTERLFDIDRSVDQALEARCPHDRKCVAHDVLHYLAWAAAAGDRELFDALGSVAVAMQDMIPLGPDRDDPTLWYVRAG